MSWTASRILGTVALGSTTLFVLANTVWLHQDLFTWWWPERYRIRRYAAAGLAGARGIRTIRVEFLGGIWSSSILAFLGVSLYVWQIRWVWLLVLLPSAVYHYGTYLTLYAIRYPRSASPRSLALLLLVPAVMTYAACVAFIPRLGVPLPQEQYVLVAGAFPGLCFLVYFVVHVVMGYRPPQTQ